jgi:hypothetical protein
MTQHRRSPEQAEIMRQLAADRAWLAEQGVQLSQWGPDRATAKVRVYLVHYGDEARQVLIDRYGDETIVVDTQPRRWGFTASAG